MSAHTPYFWSRRLFPRAVRDDVLKLHAFYRTVKDFMEEGRAGLEKFERLEQRWHTIKQDLKEKRVATPLDDSATEHVLANMAYLTHRHGFDLAWTDAFLKSMRWDLQKHEYRALKDLRVYMYGSAEVFGLMMVRIIGLPEETMKAARLQARAMQYITFLRDIPLQNGKGFAYFPQNDIKKYGLKSLSEKEARTKPGMFADFMHAELLRYAQWQADANEGFAHIPRRYRVPLLTAVDSYNWTARQLKYDPMTVFEKQLRPQKRQIARQAVRNTMRRS
jgi:phytoene synthase